MAELKRMTERQATKAFFAKKITRNQYLGRLHEIGSSRHANEMRKKKSGWF